MKRSEFKIKVVLLVALSAFVLSNCQSVRHPIPLSPPPGPDSPLSSHQDYLSNEPLQCGSPEDCFNMGVAAEKNGKRGEARPYFRIILDQNNGTPWSHRAGYLLAKWDLEEKSGSPSSLLLALQKEYPEMGDYTAKLLGDDAFNQGDFAAADKTYSHIFVVYPDTVLRPQILIRKGETLYQLKDYDQSGEMFSLYLRENPKDEKTPEILNKMVNLYAENHEWEKGGKVFRDLQARFPDTTWSQDAEKKISFLALSPSDREKFRLTPQELFNQGKNLYEIGRFEKAIEIWKKLGQRAGSQEPFLPEMELKTGLAFLPLKKYSEASGHLERFLKKYPHSDFAPEALLGLARIAVREENETDLKRIQKKGEQLFSRQEAYYRLLYLVGNYYEDHRQASKAHAYFQMIIRDLPQSSVAPDALWKEGWISYKEGDYLSAEKNLSKLLERYSASPLQAQGLYWEGRVKERMGNPDGAQSIFRKLCRNFSHSYYCHLARKRILPEAEEITAPAQELPPSSDLSAQTSFAYLRDDHFIKAKELMLMSLAQEASREFNYLADHYRDKPSLLQIDRELIQAGDFYHALKNLRAQFPDILDRGRSDETPLLWELAYPKEVVEQIHKLAKEISIEPEFVAGIMREESVFDVRATSKSGAMGLMQLMPFTGEWVAQQLGVASFVREKLYDQEMNIRFGAFYLDHLNQKFQGNLYYTAASYNAGPEAVNKWIVNGNFTDLEEFVENIPYQETRYYVKRVIKSYEEFKEIRSRSN